MFLTEEMILISGNVPLVLSFDIQYYRGKTYQPPFYKVTFYITLDIYQLIMVAPGLAKDFPYTVETFLVVKLLTG